MTWLDWLWLSLIAVMVIGNTFTYYADSLIRTENRNVLDEIQAELNNLGGLVDAYSEVPALVQNLAVTMELLTEARSRID